MSTGVKLIVAGFVLCLIGVASFAYGIYALNSSSAAMPEFRVPGEFTSRTSDEGRYYVWDCTTTNFDGEVVQRSDDLPDGYKVVVKSGGNLLEFEADRSTTYSVGNHRMQSVGFVRAPANSELVVEVSGPIEPFRVASVSQASFGEAVFNSILPFLIGVPSVVFGFLLGVIGVIVIVVQGRSRETEPGSVE